MKRNILVSLAILLGFLAVILVTKLKAAEEKSFQTFEYATIRWAGRENTHLIRPDGKAEFLRPLLAQVKRPDRVDERALLMNIAINAVAREGFEVAAVTDDTVLMRRAITSDK